MRGARLGHAQPGEPLQRGARQVHAAGAAGAHRGAAHARGGTDRHAAGVPGDAQAGDLLAQAGRGPRAAPGERRADHRAAQPPRVLQLRGLPRLRRARAVHQLLADPDLSQARPPPALPLLRLRREGAQPVPQVRERAYLLSGHRLRARGGGTAPRVPSRAHRPAGPRHGHRQAPVRNHPRRISAKAITTCWWARR